MKKFHFKHLAKILLCGALVGVFATQTPISVLADTQTKYINDLKIAYGDDGKSQLEAAGYTVLTNANEGGEGGDVWIGYTTTTDESDAITDVAMMNMNGKYSFDAYAEEIKNLDKQVTEKLEDFSTAIAAYQTSTSPFAAEAKKLMNAFTDEDVLDASGNPTGIGDILADPSTDSDTLHMIFMEGNEQAILSIENALALANVVDEDGNTMLTNLSNIEYSEEVSPELTNARTTLSNAFDDFHLTAIAAKEAYDTVNEAGGWDKFTEANPNLTTEQELEYASYLTQYDMMENTQFGDEAMQMTLLDFALLDKEEENEDGDILDNTYLEVLAKSMTDGQLALVESVGLMTLFTDSFAADNSTKSSTLFKKLEKTLGDSTLSVFYGVDRTLFSDPDTVALTSEAIAEKAATEGSSFGQDAQADQSQAKTLAIVFGCTAGVGILLAIGGGVMRSMVSANAYLGSSTVEVVAGQFVTKAIRAGSCLAFQVGSYVMLAVGVIAMIAGLVLMIIQLNKLIIHPTTQEITYTEIPRAIVEKPQGSNSFITYYAAKLIDASEEETDSLKLYGDLNGLNKKNEWVALYYTKNTAVGTPLTETALISDNNATPEGYSAVHKFHESVAYSTNALNNSGNETYIFFQTADASSQTSAGSIFGGSSVALGISTFAFGAIVAAAGTYLVMRRKRTTAAM